MSRLTANQFQMRSKITSGSPKKNAAWRSLSNTTFGKQPRLRQHVPDDEHGDQQARLPEPEIARIRLQSGEQHQAAALLNCCA